MAVWPRHMILLVITSNNIPLNLPIVFIYHFVLNGSSFQYTNPHLSIVGNWLSYIVLLQNALAAILFIRKCSFRYPTAVSIPTH